MDYTSVEFALALQQVFGYTLTAYQRVLEEACPCCNDLVDDIMGEVIYVHADHPQYGDYRGHLIIDSKGVRPEGEALDEILSRCTARSIPATSSLLESLTINPDAVDRAVQYIQANISKYNAWGDQ